MRYVVMVSAVLAFGSLDAPARAQDRDPPKEPHRYQRLFGEVNLSCPAKTSPRAECSFSLAKRPEPDKGQSLFFWGSFWQGTPKMGISYLASPGEVNQDKRGVSLRVRGDAGGDTTQEFECVKPDDPECHSSVISVDAEPFAGNTQLTVTALADGQPRLQFVLAVSGLRDALNAAENPELR